VFDIHTPPVGVYLLYGVLAKLSRVVAIKALKKPFEIDGLQAYVSYGIVVLYPYPGGRKRERSHADAGG
jgi:hypothetical protein